jgi:transposase
MAPGNTADVAVLVPIVDRLRHRFGIGRVCVVADRGMISGPTIAALEERGLEYVLGVRERTDKRVRECPVFCVRGCRSMLRKKDSVDHGEEDRRERSGRTAEGLRAA